MSDTRTVQLWYCEGRDTEKAWRYCRLPDSRNPGLDLNENPNFIWVPISVTEHRTKFPAKSDERPLHLVKIQEWFATDHNL